MIEYKYKVGNRVTVKHPSNSVLDYDYIHKKKETTFVIRSLVENKAWYLISVLGKDELYSVGEKYLILDVQYYREERLKGLLG